MITPRPLRLAPVPAAVRREHADRATYKAWIYEHCSSYAVRWARLDDYDRFADRWPSLRDWFDAPLRQRLLDKENCVRGQHPHGGASVIMPYLTYLSLVHGVGLDYPVLLARTFTSPFRHQARYGGLDVDADLFDRHVVRLTQLGYATARTQLVWPLGRMLLHRGDPDLTALGVDDLDELRAAIDAFTARLRLDPMREFYSRAPIERPPAVTANGYLRSGSLACTRPTCCCSTSASSTGHPPDASTSAAGSTSSPRPTRSRRSASSSSATCSCTWTPALAGRRPCATPATRCAGW